MWGSSKVPWFPLKRTTKWNEKGMAALKKFDYSFPHYQCNEKKKKPKKKQHYRINYKIAHRIQQICLKI